MTPPSTPIRTLILLVLGLAVSARAADETLTPIRPGVPGKSPFWNQNARQFMFAPAFDIRPVGADAKWYRLTATGSDGKARSFEAAEPWAPLTPIWADVPAGLVELKVEGLDGHGGRVVGAPHTITIRRASPFNGPYGKAVLPYDESARVALASVMHEPFVQSWRTTGKPDPDYALYRYAAKIIGSLTSGGAMFASQSPRPDDADDAIEIGRRAADYLISISAPAGSPLAYFPPTYHDAKPTERENDAWTMLMTPAEAAQGYLDLYDVTHDDAYRRAAVRIADTYRNTQSLRGTWPLKVDNTTGNPIANVELIPSVVINFLDRLDEQYKIDAYRTTRDRSVAWVMENPAATFDWKAQFDDAKVRGAYENLSKHEACEFAGYLFRHGKDDPAKIGLAKDILRWAEDQFVVWENPPDFQPRAAALASKNWFLPCSLEQYAMFEPISGSSGFMIVAYVRAHQATGDELYLKKAQSLANALTAAQEYHKGRYPTRMIKEDLAYWINSTINTARAMKMLADEQHRTAR
jgi:maltose/maltodextrin transport system substrate-binding protein